MRRVREILRPGKHECGATDRAIARSLGIARSTVAGDPRPSCGGGAVLQPLPASLSDRVLEGRCSTPAPAVSAACGARPS